MKTRVPIQDIRSDKRQRLLRGGTDIQLRSVGVARPIMRAFRACDMGSNPIPSIHICFLYRTFHHLVEYTKGANRDPRSGFKIRMPQPCDFQCYHSSITNPVAVREWLLPVAMEGLWDASTSE